MDTLLSPCRRRLLGAVGALTALGVAGCSKPGVAAEGQRFNGLSMGSAYTVRTAGRALSAAQLERLAADVQTALDSVDARMSLYREDSELSRLNAQPMGHALAVSGELLQVLQSGQQVARLSGGAFDMTVAPLVVAWGFGPGVGASGPAIPEAAQLQDCRRRLGHAALDLDAASSTVFKHREGLALDLGGIAKGHGVDRAARALLDAGLDNFMVEVGGEVRTAGLNHLGQAWRIGIEEPDAAPRRARLVLPVSGQSVATSGDYRIYFEVQGRRYSHTIDPASGEPIAHGLASVTVVAGSCMQADALATALNVMGPERGMALAQREGIAAHFIVRGPGGQLLDHSSQALIALRAGQAA
jgi:thiamine biosynthesis lipoprotein